MKIVYTAVDITNDATNTLLSSINLSDVYVSAMGFVGLKPHTDPTLTDIENIFKLKVNAFYIISNNGKRAKVVKSCI